MANAWTPKLALILSIVAAVLALTAALIRYVKHGEVSVALVATAVFIFIFGLAVQSRNR